MDSASQYEQQYSPREQATLAAMAYQDLISSIPKPPRKRSQKPNNCYPNLHRSSNQKIRNHHTRYTSENFTSPYSGHEYKIKCDEDKPVILDALTPAVTQFEKYLNCVGSMKVIAFTVYSEEKKRGQKQTNDLMRSLRKKFGTMAYYKNIELANRSGGKHYAVMIGLPLDIYGTTRSVTKDIRDSWAYISDTKIHIDRTYEVRSLGDLAQPVGYLSYHCKVRTKAFDRKSESFYSSSKLQKSQLEQLYSRLLEKKESSLTTNEPETLEPALQKAVRRVSKTCIRGAKRLISKKHNCNPSPQVTASRYRVSIRGVPGREGVRKRSVLIFSVQKNRNVNHGKLGRKYAGCKLEQFKK